MRLYFTHRASHSDPRRCTSGPRLYPLAKWGPTIPEEVRTFCAASDECVVGNGPGTHFHYELKRSSSGLAQTHSGTLVSTNAASHGLRPLGNDTADQGLGISDIPGALSR